LTVTKRCKVCCSRFCKWTLNKPWWWWCLWDFRSYYWSYCSTDYCNFSHSNMLLLWRFDVCGCSDNNLPYAYFR